MPYRNCSCAKRSCAFPPLGGVATLNRRLVMRPAAAIIENNPSVVDEPDEYPAGRNLSAALDKLEKSLVNRTCVEVAAGGPSFCASQACEGTGPAARPAASASRAMMRRVITAPCRQR